MVSLSLTLPSLREQYDALRFPEDRLIDENTRPLPVQPWGAALAQLLAAGWPEDAARSELLAMVEGSEDPTFVHRHIVDGLIRLDQGRDHEREYALLPPGHASGSHWTLADAVREIAWRTTLAEAEVEDLYERRYPLADHIEDLGIRPAFAEALADAECTLINALAAGRLVASGQCEPPGGLSPSDPTDIPPAFWRRASLDEAHLSARSRRGEVWRLVVVRPADVAHLWPEAGEEAALGTNEAPASPQEMVPDKTGAPGRPTSMHLVKQEFERRAEARIIKDTLAAEARALEAWLRDAYPEAPPSKAKTIQNTLRDRYRQVMAEAPTGTPP